MEEKVKGLTFYVGGEDHAYFPGDSVSIKCYTDLLEGTDYLQVIGEQGCFKDIEFDYAEIRMEDNRVIQVVFLSPEWIGDNSFKWEVGVFWRKKK